MEGKPASWQEAIPLAKAVYQRHCAGCCAHIVTDDGNIEQDCVNWALARAQEQQHPDCIALLEMLARMSSTQRGRLYKNGAYFAS